MLHLVVTTSGKPSAKISEAEIAVTVPNKKSVSGTKLCSTSQETMPVRMIDEAVLKHPRVAPAYFNMTAHRRPPKAFIAITDTTCEE